MANGITFHTKNGVCFRELSQLESNVAIHENTIKNSNDISVLKDAIVQLKAIHSICTNGTPTLSGAGTYDVCCTCVKAIAARANKLCGEGEAKIEQLTKIAAAVKAFHAAINDNMTVFKTIGGTDVLRSCIRLAKMAGLQNDSVVKNVISTLSSVKA